MATVRTASLTRMGSTADDVAAFVRANSSLAGSAPLAEKIDAVSKLKEEALKAEKAGWFVNKHSGPARKTPSQGATTTAARCANYQEAAVILLRSTLANTAERKAVLNGVPGLREWLATRVSIFTNHELTAIVQRALLT